MATFLLRAEAIESTLPEWRNVTGIIKVNVYPTKREESMLASKRHYLSDELNYGDKVELIGNISIPST
ncbi:MAG: hypothetical protein AABY49_11080, partial [Planctomycetota bacterium]